MTMSGGGDRILKDHLQNHIHLTNCIHLKNHLHKHTPFAADTSLLRDLTLLQESRRHLRESSRSPNSRPSPSLVRLKGECARMFSDPPLSTEESSRMILGKEGKNRKTGISSHVLSHPSESRERSVNVNKKGECTQDRSLNAETSCNRGKIANKDTKKEKMRRCTSDRRNRPSISTRDANKARPITSENSSLSSVLDSEAFPLLLDASGSQGSIDHLGELGIFAKPETDSDSYRVRREFTNRHHQNLTQKYMPTTFKDVVGQNLVVKALSNAVTNRKIGLLYVFYGPHGTGKTACARIFAKALNCNSIDSPKPCSSCDSCIEQEIGKSRNVVEIGPVSNINYESILKLFENHIPSKSQYRVFIFDECDAMASDCWSAIMKVVYRAPRRVAIILVCSSLSALPHVVVSRSQKFAFTKLSDADIVYTLELIARKEDLEIDRDALKLIASKSDGSLRDAEMTLDQLSLLGQKISLCLVQELIGLISDEKLLDLLDFALSSDTINTVRNLRDITASGVEPLALMSQLATVITDVLAGSYVGLRERPKRKFFQRQALSKEDMEKLRQALKTLSEAEKQLRASSERMTWLTAALLQLAPEQHDTSSDHSPVVINDSSLRLEDRDAISVGVGKSEIVEVEGDSQGVCKNGCDEKTFDEGDLSLSIVRTRVSLAHVMNHAESVGLSKRAAVPSADELEQENMRLEPRSRRLLCWNPPRINRPTFSCLKIRRRRRRKTQAFRKFISCGRCLSSPAIDYV